MPNPPISCRGSGGPGDGSGGTGSDSGGPCVLGTFGTTFGANTAGTKGTPKRFQTCFKRPRPCSPSTGLCNHWSGLFKFVWKMTDLFFSFSGRFGPVLASDLLRKEGRNPLNS